MDRHEMLLDAFQKLAAIAAHTIAEECRVDDVEKFVIEVADRFEHFH